MLQHFGTAYSKTISAMDENLILAEIEGVLSENLANNVPKDDIRVSPAADRRRMRSFPILVVCGIAVVAALVPASLRKIDGANKASHQAMGDAGRSPLSD